MICWIRTQDNNRLITYNPNCDLKILKNTNGQYVLKHGDIEIGTYETKNNAVRALTDIENELVWAYRNNEPRSINVLTFIHI